MMRPLQFHERHSSFVYKTARTLLSCEHSLHFSEGPSVILKFFENRPKLRDLFVNDPPVKSTVPVSQKVQRSSWNHMVHRGQKLLLFSEGNHHFSKHTICVDQWLFSILPSRRTFEIVSSWIDGLIFHKYARPFGRCVPPVNLLGITWPANSRTIRKPNLFII